MTEAPGRWSPAQATKEINGCAKGDALNLSWKFHAKDRMKERDLIQGDILHVLKCGFVYLEPEASTRAGYWKYKIEATTPNSNGRFVRVVVIPDGKCELAIVTVMWRDE